MFGINATRDISKLSQITLAQQLVKWHITISKYRSWYLRQISLQIMLLPVQIYTTSKVITDWIVTGCWLFFSLAIGLDIISTAICSWKLTTEKKNKMSKGKLLILIQLHGTHILLRKVSSTHVQIFFNMKFFFFAFKILCLHTWCIQIIFALPGKDTLICTSMQIQ